MTFTPINNISLYSSPQTRFSLFLGFFIPFTYLPPYADDLGLSKQEGALLISFIGIANTVARVGCGFISDFPRVDALLLNNFSLVFAGVATALFPFCKSFLTLSISCIVFGCGIGK